MSRKNMDMKYEYFLTTLPKNVLKSLFLKIPISTYFIIDMCALFSQKNLQFSPKEMFFKET